jgi:2-polyprenyl-6-methoxyphenol hydroxylase-like FAD-dependent oxidoreductase
MASIKVTLPPNGSFSIIIPLCLFSTLPSLNLSSNSMSHSKLDPIAIVGGGPCGLTFARLLETAGINYIVFERDISSKPTPRYQGGTLDLHADTGQKALRRAGLFADFERLARRDAMTMTVQDSQGNHRTTFGGTRDAPEIDRLQLRQMLLDSIPAYRIRWGKTLCSAERGSKKQSGSASWVLLFADGTIESGFSLVVGADGAWSKLRQLVSDQRYHILDVLLTFPQDHPS